MKKKYRKSDADKITSMTWCDDVHSYKHTCQNSQRNWEKKTCDSHLCNTSKYNTTQHTPNKDVAGNNHAIWLVDHDHNWVEPNRYSPIEWIWVQLFVCKKDDDDNDKRGMQYLSIYQLCILTMSCILYHCM